ncbi:hypothetical protein Y032_0045g1293 [Ancylostoma ceylanicum]|uniref:Uncharacterized protein n=1 Tax=Ancylostoma ceylanicum TaxID=53326 RepID=A0A016UE01_9BILA|nr:hypothetical protein Y032_0045g1293 [Ancylostoma ceylanicum]
MGEPQTLCSSGGGDEGGTRRRGNERSITIAAEAINLIGIVATNRSQRSDVISMVVTMVSEFAGANLRAKTCITVDLIDRTGQDVFTRRRCWDLADLSKEEFQLREYFLSTPISASAGAVSPLSATLRSPQIQTFVVLCGSLDVEGATGHLREELPTSYRKQRTNTMWTSKKHSRQYSSCLLLSSRTVLILPEI